jgi:hypothetical protein
VIRNHVPCPLDDGPLGRPRVFKARCRAGGASSAADRGGTDPLALARLIPFRAGGHLHGSFTIHRRRTEDPTPVGLTAHPVSQPEPRARTVHSPKRRAEHSKPTARTAHSLAARPRTLPGSLSLVPPLGLEPRPTVSETAGSANWPRAAWSGYRESDPGLHHGKVMRYHYATSAWSLPGELNSHYLRTGEACCRYH